MPATRNDNDRLRLFVEKVDQLVDRRGVKERTVKASFKMTFGGDESQSALITNSGDEEDLRSVLLAFRPFMAAKEDVYANRIFNVLEKRLTDEGLRSDARVNRKAWNNALQGYGAIHANGKIYSGESCFDLRVNGDLFHSDVDKAAEYAALPPFMQGMIHQEMITLVVRGTKVLWPTRNLAEHALTQGHLDLT